LVAASFALPAWKFVRKAPLLKPVTIAWLCADAKTSCSASQATNKSALPPPSTTSFANSLAARLRLRVVSAGGCGACEADTNVLGTIGWDLSRFGIQFVASPRHADGLLITGCISKNMELALKKAWDAVPEPKIVIAVGACAIAGGPFVGNPQILNGAASVVPVDLYIPGCPPHPLTILDGLLRLLDRLEKKS
jgi:Ni,Fe-hydrogenase III small subunit